jgi:Bacterial SH3 domain
MIHQTIPADESMQCCTASSGSRNLAFQPRIELDVEVNNGVDYSPMKPTPIKTIVIAAGALLLMAIAPGRALAQQGQPARGGQGEALLAPVDAKVLVQVRVPVNHANIHTGPSTGNEVIVLAAKGTVLPMVARRGEWLQVQLSPDMRKTGMVMRWYKNQGSGWVHDSMLEFVTPEPK